MRVNRNVRPERLIQAMAKEAAARPAAPIPTQFGYMVPRTYDQQEHDHRADSQEVQRHRRRQHLTVVYDERFSLSDELAAVLSDVPDRIDTDPRPGRWTVAVGAAFSSIAQALTDIATAIKAPVPAWSDRLTAESVADGTWPDMLMEVAHALEERLRVELGRPYRAAGGEPIGEWLANPLRDMDRAAKTLDSYVRRVHSAESPDAPEPPSAYALAVGELRARHFQELRALRDRHRAEWDAFSANTPAGSRG
ncbi:hypothetical protein [Nocardia nova]|uniref:hypothetical protein n=1 Tax=Nocardia nova TaxID=37330 RepID=UPI00273820B3|nr:hypothetical protein [Nocardia nova]